MNKTIFYLFLLWLISFHAKAAKQNKSGWVSDNNQHIWRVEIVDDEFNRMKGLMFRPYLFPDSGMLFIFEHPKPVNFWMKNTWLALDMRFYDAQGKLITHYPSALPCLSLVCDLYPANGSVKYVLETNAQPKNISQATDLSVLIIDDEELITF